MPGIDNPESVPDWNRNQEDDRGEEQPNPVESQTIPRTPAGLVSESGDIFTEDGKRIGKVAESEDGRSLVGNPVSATGDVVNSEGDVLGRASLDEDQEPEYTTSKDQKSEKPGFFNSAKGGVYKTMSGVRSGFGFVGKKNSEASGTEKAEDTVKESTSEGPGSATTESTSEAPEEACTEAQNVTSDAQDAAPEAQDTLSQADDAAPQNQDAKSESQDNAATEAPVQLEDHDQSADEKAGQTTDDKQQATDVKDDQKSADTKDDQAANGKDQKKADEKESQENNPDADLDVDQAADAKNIQVPNVQNAQDTEEKGDQKVSDTKDEAKVEQEGSGELNSESDEKSQSNLDTPQQPEVTESPAPIESEQSQAPKDDIKSEGTESQQAEVNESEKGEAGEPENGEGGDAESQGDKSDYSILKNAKVNKIGNLVDDKGEVVGHIVDGDAKKLQGKKADGDGNIWNDSGKIVGKAEPIPENERDGKKDFAPFENFPDAIVEVDGRVVCDGRQVGTVIEGDSKRLKGSKVDEDGDILDRNGNVVGKAEAWDEPEPVPEEEPEIVDRSVLAGKRVNKAGNVVDSAGTIFGKVVEGNVSAIVGRMCDKEGSVRSESGDIVGKAEVVPEGEREGSKEGPFAELSGLTVRKDGKVVTPSNEVVGRLVSGDAKTLFGRSVDEDGDVTDKNGNVLGKAERYEEPEEEEKKKGPMAGRKVNREGNVLDENGNIIGKLISGDALTCSGKEVDDDGDVVNSKGNTIGHVALLEDIPPTPEPEETDEQKTEREQAEKDKKLAGQLSGCIEQSLDRVRPICKLIDDKIDKAERTPKEELDEEDLVKQVKPLIEEGGKILDETNGVIRGLDPDGRIQRNAKHKSNTKDASPEEHHLAEVLKELTGTVSKTVDGAKRKIQDMPHAKKELNPLWGLLMEPLGQILAAVGLLLNGVLGLVGRLLSGLGLGGLVDGLLGGLGLNKILGSLGLGSAYDALVGKDQKKKK